MRTVAEQIAADLAGPAAIPRRNGEPVFSEPWESRAFGIAIALCESGLYSWDEFRHGLIAQITTADARGDHTTYYERFLAALTELLAAKGLCATDEIDQRMALVAAAGDD